MNTVAFNIYGQIKATHNSYITTSYTFADIASITTNPFSALRVLSQNIDNLFEAIKTHEPEGFELMYNTSGRICVLIDQSPKL